MNMVLLIFVRNPKLGSIKTRLAATLGAEEALRIYHILLKKTQAVAEACDATRWLYYSDFVDSNDSWPPVLFRKKVQHPGDLGQRMEAAFREAFEAGAGKVVIIGSDCPDLTAELLHQAFELLDQADFVLGPVPDGGYYLLGMKAIEPLLFQGIQWSTATVREKTLEKMASLGMTFLLLPMLSDVDTEADWRALKLE